MRNTLLAVSAATIALLLLAPPPVLSAAEQDATVSNAAASDLSPPTGQSNPSSAATAPEALSSRPDAPPPQAVASSTETSNSNSPAQHTLTKEEIQGHLDLNNFDRVSDGIFRGSNPSDHDINVLSQYGIKTIVNLRMKGKATKHEEAIAKENGIRYIHIPMGFRHPQDQNTVKALEVICDPQNQPVFVHCLQGSDRTGMIVGIYRRLFDNWSFTRTYAEMHEHHFKPWLMGMKKAVRDCAQSARLVSVAKNSSDKEKEAKQLAKTGDAPL
ncbi:MAG: tyrosine-protein phosphatase [Cyanobacteria bacterium HKST-UBA02]|nr:tyrosine-protein phosphatase [Cyanobacteria bacterium HKST-UBA02]